MHEVRLSVKAHNYNDINSPLWSSQKVDSGKVAQRRKMCV